MGNFNTKQNVDSWNDINTEDISSTIPYMSGMNQESKELANVLANYLNTESESENINNTSFMKKYNVTENEHIERTSTELSATSPFITSDLYNKMVQNNNMVGGGKDDSSSTSTTSDYDQKQSSEKKPLTSNSDISTRESVASRGEFSYQSSSAHTGGALSTESHNTSPEVVEENKSETEVNVTDSTTEKEKEDVKVESSTEENATTIADDNSSEKKQSHESSSSEVNTSDINMVSINTEN